MVAFEVFGADRDVGGLGAVDPFGADRAVGGFGAAEAFGADGVGLGSAESFGEKEALTEGLGVVVGLGPLWTLGRGLAESGATYRSKIAF